MNGDTKPESINALSNVIKITYHKPASELLTAMRQREAKGPMLSPGQARLFRSKMARRAAFVDLLAMSFVEGRS